MTAAHETRTQDYGREIFARVARHGPPAFTAGWFDERLMNFTMSNEGLKVQLFRFIDSLPRLADPRAVSGHLREYLGAAGRGLPAWVRWGVKLLPSGGLGGRLLAGAAKTNAEHLARRFIAGSTVGEAVRSVARMHRADSPSPWTCSARPPSPRRKRTASRSSISIC